MLGVDQLAAVLRQNLQEQWGITTIPVLYGAHMVKQTMAPPRIVVAMRQRAVNESFMGDHGPGPAEDGDGLRARTLYTRKQDIAVWVRGPAAPADVPDEDVARWQEAACAELMHQVTASLWEAGGGGCEPDGAVVVTEYEWLTLESADMRHGAEVRIDGFMRIPVRDVERPRLNLTLPLTTTAVYAVGGDGVTEQLTSIVGPPLPP